MSVPQSHKERQARLTENRSELRQALEKRRLRSTCFRVVEIAILVGCPVAAVIARQPIWLVGCVYAFPLLLSHPSTISLELELLDLDDQLDAIDFESADIDLRAERQLKLHQRELKRYYDQQLAQSQWVFVLGAFCVAAGVAIAGATIYFLAMPGASRPQDKLLIGAVGGVSSLLTNFVAAIYLRIHGGTVNALVEFHNRLVATHRIHFAYFLATKIDEDVVRARAPLLDETLAALALKVTDGDHMPSRGHEGNEAQVKSTAAPKPQTDRPRRPATSAKS